MITICPKSIYLSRLFPSMFAHLFLMKDLLPTVPCKCHSVPVPRSKKGSGAIRKRVGAKLMCFKGCQNYIIWLIPVQFTFTVQ